MTYIKYPRTFHMPWSEGITNDDKVLKDTSFFEGRDVVVTIKMDGENTTMYHDHIHARSIDSANHPSRDWVKAFWGNIRYQIPTGWRICGENMYAKHSIKYDNLPSYFFGISIWDENNMCLPWLKTQQWFDALGIHSVELLHYGCYNERNIRTDGEYEMKKGAEGYVIRYAGGFRYDQFHKCVGKVVRKDHVQTDDHWIHQEIMPNRMEKK